MTSDQINLAVKRKVEGIRNEHFKKKRKKRSILKVPPPSSEEINRLRETENIFHSNLFRLQIEEMLNEVKVKTTSKQKLNSWIKEVKNFLLNINSSYSLETSVDPYTHIPTVPFPMKSELKHADLSFNFVKPKSVGIFGSYDCDCILKHGNIDMFVEMPKEVFQKEDYLNEKYIRKRNIYLSCIASELSKARDDSLFSNLEYMMRDNAEKPILLLQSANPKLQNYKICIYVVLETGVFKETRFFPTMNNIRYGWMFDSPGDGKMNYPTPYYNSVICRDIISLQNDELRKKTFNESPNFRDAYLLLNVWLRQRKLIEGFGSMSGFLIGMFMVYLQKNKKLNHLMSSYQIIRTVWLSLSQIDWHTDGISLADTPSNVLDLFTSNYDVTFIDITGSTNLASSVSLSTYSYFQRECKYAVQYLDDTKSNNFTALFMIPVQTYLEFDHVICFDKLNLMREIVKVNADHCLQMDYRCDKISQFFKVIYKLLKQSLGKRVSMIFCEVEPRNLTWSVSEKMPSYQKLLIGLKLDSEHALAIIDKGPTANLPEAVEFRQFWDKKSELRRFRDGDVCEAVLWANTDDTVQNKRLIVRNILHYILEEKLNIHPDQYMYVADQVETLVFKTYNKIFSCNGSGEEASVNIIKSFLDLSQKLQKLEELPLEITSTQGTSAVFRYTGLFPVLSNACAIPKKYIISNETILKFRTDVIMKNIPLYISPVEAVIQLAPSNKWPEDLIAIRKLQAAFYVKLASDLKIAYNYVCHPHHNFIDILKDGFVFRIRLANTHEISAVRRQILETGEIQYTDNEESVALEKALIRLPYLTSAIHGLHQRNPVLGPGCMLVKRWLRSQLIDEYYFPDICVDLIMTYLCLNPQPYSPAFQPQTLLFRFLKMISTDNWYLDPLFININDELTRNEILEIESAVNKTREQLPPLVLITPFDKTGITWTQEQPSLMILKKLSQLSEASLRVINGSILRNEDTSEIYQIFGPPLRGYDFLIWISKSVSSSAWYATFSKTNNLPAVRYLPNFEKLPIVDFHPTRIYVEKLRKYYGNHCLFFYDSYGGSFVGVLFKPETKVLHDFKISNMICSKNQKSKLVFDVEAALEDFRIIGEGLVISIEKCN